MRKRNKSKRKSDKLDKNMMEKESVSEVGELTLDAPSSASVASITVASATGNGAAHSAGVAGNGSSAAVRPSSTTSRESEAEVVTSGYFR